MYDGSSFARTRTLFEFLGVFVFDVAILSGIKFVSENFCLWNMANAEITSSKVLIFTIFTEIFLFFYLK